MINGKHVHLKILGIFLFLSDLMYYVKSNSKTIMEGMKKYIFSPYSYTNIERPHGFLADNWLTFYECGRKYFLLNPNFSSIGILNEGAA